MRTHQHIALAAAILAAIGLTGCEKVARKLIEPTESERADREDKKQKMIREIAVGKAKAFVRDGAAASAGYALGASFCEASLVFENHRYQVVMTSCEDSFSDLRQALEQSKVCSTGGDEELYCKAIGLVTAERVLAQQRSVKRACPGGSWATSWGSDGRVKSSDLALRGCELDAGEALSALLAEPDLARVTSVTLEDVTLTTAAWEALLTAPSLTHDAPMRKVTLTRAPIDAPAQALLDRHLWRAEYHAFESTGVRASILGRIGSPALTTLALIREERVDDAFMGALTSALEAPRLEVLTIVGGSYGSGGLDALAPLLGRAPLIGLSLARSRADDAAIARALGALHPRDQAHRFMMLDLSHTATAEASAAAIASIQRQLPDAFSDLCLEHTSLTLADARTIADAIEEAGASTAIFLYDGSSPNRYAKLSKGAYASTIHYRELGCGWVEDSTGKRARGRRR